MAEYKELIQGIRKLIDLKVKFLKVYGDSKIIIKQVHNTIHCLSNNLKNYQHQVWDLIENLCAFNIFPISDSKNSNVDMLANVASKLILSKEILTNSFWV